MPISKRFTWHLHLLASDHARLFSAAAEWKIPASPANHRVEKIDDFLSHQHVFFSVSLLVADAFLGEQNLRNMIRWDIAPKAGQSRGFAPGHLPLVREKIIQVGFCSIGMRRIFH